MGDSELPQMADILMPTLEPTAGIPWLWIAAAIIFAAIGILTWRWFKNPCRQLTHKLRKGQLASRAAAHRLAGMCIGDTDVCKQLNHLRFSRSAPDKQTVLNLIQQVRKGG